MYGSFKMKSERSKYIAKLMYCDCQFDIFVDSILKRNYLFNC